MTINKRSLAPLPSAGPFIGEITNHLDPSYMGGVEVALIKGIPGDVDSQDFVYPVQYLNPFYGVTSARFEGNDSTNFNDVQKSYGMWFVPPDVGTKVLVIFVDGDPNQGYWMGCVMDDYQNQMIPGIAASKNSAVTRDHINTYGTTLLPVAEIHKKSQNINDESVIDNIPKAVHPFADRLLQQGLLLDTIRGVTSSSARREIPSAVFGISTPGPVDTRNGAKRGSIGYQSSRQAPVSRLGGTTFVMDDGDLNGNNELVRIRTRTGHQILLHNSSKLIYIANAEGTAWLEMTSQGKIDIYAADSVSIHSENDINLRAERDINFEAGRNLNMVGLQGIQIESQSELAIISSDNVYIQTDGEMNINSEGDFNIESTNNFNVIGDNSVKIESSADVHLSAKGTMYQGSNSDFNVSAGGKYFETAQQIHMNGPTAATPTSPAAASQVDTLPRFSLPNTLQPSSWTGKYFNADNFTTILTRIPTHEPYPQHENINPTQFNTIGTDAQATGGPTSQISGGVSKHISSLTTFKPNVKAAPPTPTGDTASKNLQAFLWMIRVAEGTDTINGYNTMFTGKTFNVTDPTINGIANPTYNYAVFPGILNSANGKTSSAAGAYQFTSKTWQGCQKALNLPDFSPASQDKACVYLLSQTNSINDIQNGNFTIAVSKNKKIWASLPGANYPGQPMQKLSDLQTAYLKAGGTVVA